MAYSIKGYGVESSVKNQAKREQDMQIVEKYVKYAYELNKKIFAFCDIEPDFKVLLYYTRKSFEEGGRRTKRWEFAAANKNRIGIFAPSVLEKKTTQKLSIYKSTFIHEISHIFYMQCVGTYTPRWLMEGLAANIEERDYCKEFGWHGKPKPAYLNFAVSNESNDQNALEYARSSYLMVKIIIKKIGLKGIMVLIAKYAKHPVKKNYEKLFKEFMQLPNKL